MVKLTLDISSYNRIKTLLPEICPEVEFHLEYIDENLDKLGFCKSAPCFVAFELDEQGFNELIDTLSYIEIDAFNTPNGENPKSDSFAYHKYLKYGCLFDILNNAEIIKAE
ncbi:MAG: hypothetical protein IJA62_00645 [Ruminococcus sp.]|nr:hypothetical protein [Ruminococcus sp.]